jgi:hypothetical protein
VLQGDAPGVAVTLEIADLQPMEDLHPTTSTSTWPSSLISLRLPISL